MIGLLFVGDALASRDALRRERPGLADALGEREGADEAVALVERADPRLVDLLIPAVPDGPVPDLTGEDLRVDLLDADLRLEGTELVGSVRGIGAAENGVWVGLDTRGGPALDLLMGFGRGWSREAVLDGGAPSPALARDVMPRVEGDTVSFRADLSGSARFDPAHAGTAVAMVRSFDGVVEDVGPAGILGQPPAGAADVLVALARSGPVTDADLAVALAVTFGALRAVVAPEVAPVVDADAVAWLRYGEGLDAWLAAHGAAWRFSTLDPLGKLVWAWPAAQAVGYGAVALAREKEPLDLARYRFAVPDAGTLGRLRDLAPMRPQLAATANAIDTDVWARLRYRARDELMRALCAGKALDRAVCDGWTADRKAGRDLGRLGEQVVPLEEGVSSTWQLDVLAREGAYVGDCATATTLAIHTLQAVGVPAVGMGWAGADDATPTHDVPLWYDGERFFGTQRGPEQAWAKDRAFVYVTLPVVHPVNGFSLARETGGWSRGGAVAAGWASYGEVARILREGLRAPALGEWVDVQAAGGWPSW